MPIERAWSYVHYKNDYVVCYICNIRYILFSFCCLVDLASLQDLDNAFEKQRLNDTANDKPIQVSDMVMTLLPVFETAQSSYPQQ